MPKSYSVKFDYRIPLILRDGITTYVDIFRPDAPGRFPALLQRTSYDRTSLTSRGGAMDAIRAAMSGYAVVIQDIRGRYSSGGDFYTFVNEGSDGYDSVDWVASQPWCSGKVGMYGGSYVGATQWLAAKERPPSLKGIAPLNTASDYHEGWSWQGGAFQLGFNLSWAIGSLASANFESLSHRLDLPSNRLDAMIEDKDNLTSGYEHLPMKQLPDLRDNVAPYYYDWLAHPEYDEYWKSICIEDSHSDITVPAINFGGWYDIFLGGTISNYVGMRKSGGTEEARRGQRLVIGPWTHGGISSSIAGEFNFGTRASGMALDWQGMILRYYDYWLKGDDNGVPEGQPVHIFVMGENTWRREDEWPIERTTFINYHLRSGGQANTLNGDGWLSPESPADEPPDVYLYNPRNPVPTNGGGLCGDPAFMAPGAYDNRLIECRSDVLVYTTESLGEETEVTGPITVTLYASSSATDTDFTAKLLDVGPSGYARNLTDGIIRARYRTPRSPASLIEPGVIYKYTIDLLATANLFRKGHKIRLEISSSNFPRFDRNSNTGEPIGSDSCFVSALQTIHHTARHPSHMTLPMVARE